LTEVSEFFYCPSPAKPIEKVWYFSLLMFLSVWARCAATESTQER